MFNILWLSPDYTHRVNWGHQLYKAAIEKEAEYYIQYGEKCKYHGKTHVPTIIEDLSILGHPYPEVIVMENWKNINKLTGLDEIDSIFKVLYLGDYLADNRGNMARYNELVNKYKINLVLCPTPEVCRLFIDSQHKGLVSEEVKSTVLPYPVDTEVFKPRPMKKIYDVMAVFGLVSYVYPLRPRVQDMIKSMPVSSLIGDWKSGIRHMQYAKALNQSKIFVSVNGINNQITMKYTEAMSSGVLLLTDKPQDFELLGYIPGEHCVIWKDLEDLRKKILYYLEHEDERKKIAKSGMDFVRSEYSTKNFALEFFSLLKEYYYQTYPPKRVTSYEPSEKDSES